MTHWTSPGIWLALLAGGTLLAGAGFTMELFIVNLAFSQNLVDSAKSGIFLVSVVPVVAGIALLSVLSGHGKQSHTAR
ncbi:MAG TPA: Na+/H+ antiporter NhaA [Gammaproteobacteria bacterium]|nr:Na+/H+ antiporter NhaA [Gammaproteobacteria bacterium]